MTDKNFRTCLNIAKELDDVVDGNLYKCPHCRTQFHIDDAEELHDEDDNPIYVCPNCKEHIDAYDLEQISLYDYLSDSYDIE